MWENKMGKKPYMSLVIPTFNEAGNIKQLIKEIKVAMKDEPYPYELIVVDDNSPDGTYKIAKELGKKDKKIRAIIRKNEKGLSSAILEGFKQAKGNVIGVIDADLSHLPAVIPSLVNQIKNKNYDVVVGSRLIKGGSIEDWPFIRRLISWSATSMARPLTRVKDPMSGFFFIKKEVLKGRKLNPLGYKILLEILVKGDYKRAKEVPITFRNRDVGESKMTRKTQIEYLIHLGRLYKYKVGFRK